MKMKTKIQLALLYMKYRRYLVPAGVVLALCLVVVVYFVWLR